jgi:M6 family metalloprotease-like protein
MTSKFRRTRRRTKGVAALALLVLAAAVAVAPSAATPPDLADHPLLQPIDAQNWVDQEDLTWEDYVAVPDRKAEYYDPTASVGSQNQYKTAIVLVQFEDQPFLITQPPESHPFGNPQPGWTPVPQSGVNAWMHSYYAEPNEFNGGMTLHSYWMENTHGRVGVTPTTYGPYELPGKLHEYGLEGFADTSGDDSVCPAGDDCDKDIRDDAEALWWADIGCDPEVDDQCGFDNIFYVTAGHDESSTWQEFGEMLWENPEDVPAEFGPPGAENGPVLNDAGFPIPNYSDTRYVDWTSWRAAANHWPNAGGGSSTQAESSGQSVFAHEFSHLRGLPDNYNNPFADNVRSYGGYWEMMSRGTFNGPGGTHNRWQIPNAGGSALGPHHTLHYKNQLGVVMADEQVTVERNTLADQGIAVVRLQARESVPDDGELAGLTVNFGAGGDLAGNCANQGLETFYCPPGTNWAHYRVEVVDRVGNDSYAPGHGVLMSKTKNSGTPRVWIIDPKPQDIGMIDFYRPDGTPVPVVRGDPRQLNDSTLHAGTRSGADYEWVDRFNGLHFYVVDTGRDADGVLWYDVAVRRTTGDSFDRGLALGKATTKGQRPGFLATCSFPLTNTGDAGEGIFASDVYRVSAASSSADWEITLPNALAAVESGETAQVPVHVLRNNGNGAANRTTVTLTATSESDPTQTATQTCAVHTKDTTPN